MSEQATELTVRKSLFVDAPPERAFEVFTAELAAWWPLGAYSAGEQPETAVFERHVGGRVFERNAAGEESEWGEVRAWEPPRRVVFSWRVTGPTEVEVRFTAEGGGTLVELEHRGWEVLGERAAEERASYDGGWESVLGRYAEAAAR